MGSEYRWEINPFVNTLIEIMIKGGDIADKKNKDAIYDIFKYILQFYLKDKNDILYLDFDVNNNKGYYKIIGNNIITALWLSGILPNNIESVMKKNEFIFDNIKYTFDVKKRILIQKIL